MISCFVKLFEIIICPLRPKLNLRPRLIPANSGTVLAPDFKFDTSWIYFYHTLKVNFSKRNSCPGTKLNIILKILNALKFTLLNTKMICQKLMFLKFFLCYETETFSRNQMQDLRKCSCQCKQ